MEENRIQSIEKQTNNRFLNLYVQDTKRRNGIHAPYYVASRRPNPDQLRCKTKDQEPDAVIIYGIYEDKVALIKQYRYAIGGYIYEFPAGLIDSGESIEEAAVREMYEETGLSLSLVKSPKEYSKPFYTSVGMTDEACSMVFGTLKGQPTNEHQEESEDIQVVLADRTEIKRILKEEKVSLMTAYMLMHYLSETEPFGFLNQPE